MKPGLIARLNSIFALDPSAALIEQNDRVWSYQQTRDLIEKLDRILIDNDLGASTPVGLLLRNHPESLAAALGIIWTQRCLVTVNPLLPPKSLEFDLASLQLPVLIAERSDWGPLLTSTAVAAGSLGISINRTESGLVAEISVKRKPKPADLEAVPGIAVEMLTSGTTGRPKRIKLKLNSLSDSLAAGSRYESGDSDLALKKSPSLLWMPLVHIGGLWNALYQVYNGRKIVLLDRFSVDAWHHAIKKYRLRFVTLPPSALKEVLDRNYPKEDLSSLVAIRCGAAPLNHDLALEFEDRYGIPVLEAYGATEFAGGVAGWTISDHKTFGRAKRSSVGRANAGVKLRIVDGETLLPLPSNCEGLLEVSTGQQDGNSWIRTTDRARLDEDGFLYILGRADNAINRGGFKIWPEHVEDALRTHPDLVEVCVVGLTDERLGQVPVAAYELKKGVEQPPTESALKQYLSHLLKPYEIPVRFHCVPSLPRTPSLKISQLGVRELF
jgi:long-chain acyl-CoA synthetase